MEKKNVVSVLKSKKKLSMHKIETNNEKIKCTDAKNQSKKNIESMLETATKNWKSFRSLDRDLFESRQPKVFLLIARKSRC